jgi:hypothetical protein
MGFMKSSIRTSPGWISSSSSVITGFLAEVDDLDIMGTILPHKTNPPLVVDADAVLADAIPRQGFQPIAGRNTQAVQVRRGMQLQQRAASHPLDAPKPRHWSAAATMAQGQTASGPPVDDVVRIDLAQVDH